VVVAAGETRDPRHELPRALISGLALVALLFVLIQLVCIGTLPGLAASERPLVDAGSTFLGPSGGLLITLGAALSMLGTLNGSMITISRLPYAMAAAGQLPRALAVIHARYRTPRCRCCGTSRPCRQRASWCRVAWPSPPTASPAPPAERDMNAIGGRS
jgi:amino acid transporter